MKPLTVSVSLVLVIAALSLAAGIAVPAARDDVTLAQTIAQGIIAACPVTSAADENARDESAENLARFTFLGEAMRNPIHWGGQTPGYGYRPEENQTTVFNPFVWRRLYLSLFMFPGEYWIEPAGELTALHLRCRFRGEMDPGAYPYPFWHSQKKWNNYQRAAELILVFEGGKIIAGYRSGQEDPSRSLVPRVWDGQWQWTDAQGGEMPYAALYRYLFSAANPHVARLDAAYRALEAEARQHDCVFCHSPGNPAQMNPLRLLNFPNQALTTRHEIVARLEQNSMPPGGIMDEAQRQKLLELAKEFAAAGDEALADEGEFTPPHNR
jgi:hypothetical protein